jgi:hypothetical protein
MSKKTDTQLNEKSESLDTMDNKHLILSEEIEVIELEENNPIKIVRTGENWFVTLGKFRLSEFKRNKEKAIIDAKRTDIVRIIQLIECLTKIKENE